MDHAKITAMMTDNGRIPYGVGILPNPFASQQKEWERRKNNVAVRQVITNKIESLFEIRFITPPETSELIEAIVTASDSRNVLELGTCTGFTTLHILRALVGKPGACVTSIDPRPAHDKDFWAQSQFAGILKFVEGWTPQVLDTLYGQMFDLVFIDSDHSQPHTEKELGALWPITKPGTIFLMHDLPAWESPTTQRPPPVRDYMFAKVSDGTFQGVVVPTCEQIDCRTTWGEGYPPQCNPHLGIFIRK
jgi:predicted O-methyltransferase YrrM